MRQAGFVPKNHDSGVYWVRANAGSGKQRKNLKKRFIISIAFWLFIWCVSILVGSWIN